MAQSIDTVQLTDEQIAAEEEILEGVPRINWAGAFMPGIWGPANGIWIAIVFYPLWVFTDNVIYAAVTDPAPLSIVLAVIMAAASVALQIVFGITSQPFALRRALKQGTTKEEYLKRQRPWTVACVLIAVAFIILATYYNLAIRPGLA